jgi:hypothetical protein
MPAKALKIKALPRMPEKIAGQQTYKNQRLTRIEYFFHKITTGGLNPQA